MLSSDGALGLFARSAMLLGLLELHAALALAQGSAIPGNGNLTTVVRDPTGAVIPNAEVTFKGRKTLTTKTGQGGSIQVPLPFGTYTVTTSSPGFKTVEIIGLSVDTAEPPALNIILHLESAGCNPCSPVEGTAQTTASDLPNVLFPPLAYMQSFSACSADRPCTRSEKFHVDLMPGGCCVLSVTNGDGHGTDEVSSYVVFLNGKRVLPIGNSQRSSSAVTVYQDNVLKVILNGQPHSKVFIQIAYDSSGPK